MFSRALLIIGTILPLCLGITLERCPYVNAPLPTAIRSDHCDDNGCQISTSGNIQFEIDATVPYDSNYVIPSLVVIIGQHEEGYDEIVPVELPEDIGCSGLENGCPISAMDSITWGLDWDWEPAYLNISDQATIRFTLYDENEITIACFKLDVDIVD